MVTASPLGFFSTGPLVPSSPFRMGATLRFAGCRVLRDRRRFFRRAVANVSSSIIAYPHDDLSPRAVADASVEKILRIEMLRTMPQASMRDLLARAYAEEDAVESEVAMLLRAWTFDLRRRDVVLVGYDGWREITSFITPSLDRIDVPGIDFMRATFRLFLAPTDRR